MKKAFDIIVATIVILLCWPIMLVVAVMIYFKLGSPVLFFQQRPGLHGKLFKIYKFRTMADGYDASGNLLPDSKRMTAFGSFLRKYSLDELPQLFNVLMGDLSLVGPRPLLEEYLPLYSPEQAKRHNVRPGITGWAQVNGRNAVSWEEKFSYDTWYVDNASTLLDLKILWKTVLKVLQPEGVQQVGQVTTTKFTGTDPMQDEQS